MIGVTPSTGPFVEYVNQIPSGEREFTSRKFEQIIGNSPALEYVLGEKMQAGSLPDLVRMAARLRLQSPLRTNAVQQSPDFRVDLRRSVPVGSV
jgi:hypothetical protein